MYTYNCKIKRIVDGDTIIADIDLGFALWLTDVSVRMYGIDAPESRTTNLIEKTLGLKTKARVEELLPIGSIHVITTTIDKEKFGRVLGTIMIDGKESLSGVLVTEGLAKPYYGGTKK